MAHELQELIGKLLGDHTASGRERGAQVAVYHEGKLIVDAWAGVADGRDGRKVGGDTLFPVFSVTKGIAATLAHLLAERGRLDYDRPIAHYWPEFAAQGKDGITVRHALAHTSGLPYMPPDVDHAQLSDWAGMCRAMAQMKPAWPAGERFCYHPVTYSWLVGEVIRRIDGRLLQPIIEEEIWRPLGLEAMFVGLPPGLEARVAFVEEVADPSAPPVPPPQPDEQSLAPCMEPLGAWMNRSDARQACLPGCNGLMSARAVARHYAALLPGGIDGVELLPPERMRVATEPQILPGPPGVKIVEQRGLGYMLGSGGSESAFGHAGYGGSDGYADPRRRLAVGVTRNRFSPSNLALEIADEISAVLG